MSNIEQSYPGSHAQFDMSKFGGNLGINAIPAVVVLVFIAAAWWAASYFVVDTGFGMFVIAAAIIGGYMALNIGANDVANNVAAAVGSRALTLTGAIVLAMIFETAGALIAATPNTGADVLMGIGGVPEGVTAACAVKAVGGAMLGRLAPQSSDELAAIESAGLDPKAILTHHQLVTSNQIYFAATGVTHGPLLNGVRYRGNIALTHSLLLRCETGTRRMIQAEHSIEWFQLDEI